jgi:hypothetical protein
VKSDGRERLGDVDKNNKIMLMDFWSRDSAVGIATVYGHNDRGVGVRVPVGARIFWVLRIFGPKRDEVTGGWRKLHNEELHNLYSSPSIIKMIRSRRMKRAAHVARMKAKRNAYRI